ncbi:SGNH/GDSL hydrolase family protein [Nocardiopsis sp. RSe5-2]|uniref:SGNH/GDSL hydrolase family protein n=1 Tax=Nocardiopsis endophytica TaxID=3018445 RepID=A0ABT4U6T4_9ACTN|nr:SGNH/GDSL hydrolase family protein [Nocardiopsis endophytica]MDA2812653.1 SGNH/GDSL hydrolase family protein [Nocardiopsis endophytica]
MSPSPRARRLSLAAVPFAAAALAAPLLATAPASAAPVPAEDAVAKYAALGDSFTSGVGIPDQVDAECGRSDRNYPTLVSADLAPGSFTDLSCGGATTEHMTEPQGSNPPQFDALEQDTDLVTLQVGGNDMGFADIVTRCAVLGAFDPNGQPCKASFTSGDSDELQERIEETAPKIDGVLEGIAERSPDARVLLLGYPVIMPDDGSNCHGTVPIAAGDAPWLRDSQKSLNDMLAERAQAHGAEYVDTYTGSVGHDLCQPEDVRWMEPLNAVDAAPVHPNAAGHEAMAGAVLGTASAAPAGRL